MVVPSTGTTHARTVFTALTAHGLTFGFVDHAVAIRVQPIKHFARTGGEFISADRAITIGVELCEHSFPAFAFTALTHFFEPGHQGFTFGAHFLAAGVGMRREFFCGQLSVAVGIDLSKPAGFMGSDLFAGDVSVRILIEFFKAWTRRWAAMRTMMRAFEFTALRWRRWGIFLGICRAQSQC